MSKDSLTVVPRRTRILTGSEGNTFWTRDQQEYLRDLEEAPSKERETFIFSITEFMSSIMTACVRQRGESSKIQVAISFN